MIKAAVIGSTECVCDNLILTPLWEDYDILLINYISIELLVKTALGFETEIIKAIKSKKSVYMLNSSTDHIKNLPKPLTLLYNSYIATIKFFGVKSINCTDEIFDGKKCKKLLTVADLEGLKNTSLKLENKTMVTPLALDYAKENNITITRNDTI